MLAAALKQLFSPSPVKQQAYNSYVRVVEQARNPVFFSDWKIEDTVDGRFDVIILHLFLLLSRLGQEKGHADAQTLSRTLSEVFFADMDRSLREMGVGDTGVSMRIKNMAEAFYGRMKAYSDCITGEMLSESMLTEALRRNVYREKPVAPEIVASLAAYAGRNYVALKQQSLDALQSGSFSFSS